MRLNTASIYRQFVFVYIILLLFIGFDFLVFSIDGGTFGQNTLKLGYFAVAIFAFLMYRGNPVFTYDSDGEVIILDSKNPSLKAFSNQFFKHYEFPKRKLVDYTITNWPFKRRLTLKVASKDGKRKFVTVSISYLNKADRKDLERSLRGIISKNKKMGLIEEETTDAI